MCGSVDCCE